VRGRFFIDASGDGDLAYWAGVPWEKAPPVDAMMYPSLMFRINGVDVNRAGPAPWRTVERQMEEAEAAGTHTFPRKKPIVRRIIGPYQLTEEDVLGCADFADTIGVNGWPVESHVAGAVEFRWQRAERGFNMLPFRIIVPGTRGDGRPVANLYVTGRCASMTHGAQSAARVTGPCFVMGEAAGTAAGLALADGVAADATDVAGLQRRLADQGAFLGQGAPEAVL
jgi:FAD dependent oxidoreductase